MRHNLVIWLCLSLALIGLGACTFVQEEPEGDPPGAVTSIATEAATTPPEGVHTATIAPLLTVTTTLTSTLALAETMVPTGTAPVTGPATITATVTSTPTVQPGPAPTHTPSSTPTSVPSPTATPFDTPTPTTSPTPTKEPTSTPTEGPPPTPTAPPQTVFVTSHRSYTEGSDLFVVGEVVNGASIPAFGVRVIATFFDAGDRMLAAQESFAFLHETASTQANPFKIQLANSPANVSRYDLNLSWDDISVVDYDRVTITARMFGMMKVWRCLGNCAMITLRGSRTFGLLLHSTIRRDRL